MSGAPGYSGGDTEANKWGYPVYWATSSDPVYSITPNLYGKTILARIPSGATANTGTDKVLISYDLSGDQVVELWHAAYDSLADKWTADSTKRYILSSNGLAWGVAGSNNDKNFGHRGIPAPVRVIRRDEIRAGSINHRLECYWWGTAEKNYWPMQNFESDKGGILPEGIVLRIKPSVNLANKGLSWASLIVAKTLQDYGCIVGDNAGNDRTTTHVERGAAEWRALDPGFTLTSLQSLTPDDYEFIQGGYNPPYVP